MKKKHRKIYLTSFMISIAIYISMAFAFNSCGRGKRLTREKWTDSLETEIQLDNIINGRYIAVNHQNEFWYPELKPTKDLRYLPYYYLALNERYLPKTITLRYDCMVGDICGLSPIDSIYRLGKSFSELLNDKYMKLYNSDTVFYTWQYPDREDDWFIEYCSPKALIGSHSYDIDSLRIRVIGYNDRNALSLLEKYYKEINFEKELAVYYKVMLCYEGNGDLAERYYKVLKPYLAEQPEFLNSIREVLLRAALCDHNARAQELCDSLGFSLCDYRLQLPE